MDKKPEVKKYYTFEEMKKLQAQNHEIVLKSKSLIQQAEEILEVSYQMIEASHEVMYNLKGGANKTPLAWLAAWLEPTADCKSK